jgi:hypothetical protein
MNYCTYCLSDTGNQHLVYPVQIMVAPVQKREVTRVLDYTKISLLVINISAIDAAMQTLLYT